MIFQPAEEGPPEGENGGAKMMLEEGIFDRYKLKSFSSSCWKWSPWIYWCCFWPKNGSCKHL